jgi:hypothetical protein
MLDRGLCFANRSAVDWVLVSGVTGIGYIIPSGEGMTYRRGFLASS